MEMSDIAVNAELIEAGDWIGDIPDCGDLRIRTRGLNNAAFNRLRQKMIAALPRRERRSTISPEAAEKISLECLLQTCLLGWENLTDHGQSVPFDDATARRFITDPRYMRLRDACFWAAQQVADEKAEDRTDAAKNSATA